jgi:hypothetical protein
MNAIKSAVKNGRVLVDVPPDWPEGWEVLIEPVPTGSALGMREEDWPTTPEGIAALLKRWDEHEPLEMTPEEEAQWQAARKAQKEREKANFLSHGDKLRGVWE